MADGEHSMARPATAPIQAMVWDSMIRSAQDCGANSILAAHVLKKTADLLEQGKLRSDTMIQTANDVHSNTTELRNLANNIREISQHSKIVAFNLSVEAARMGAAGLQFKVVSQEMASLSQAIAVLTSNIEKQIERVTDRTKSNETLCRDVGEIFATVDREIVAFRSLMMRIEELTTSQTERIRGLEKS
ncbi:MAG: hypothetical protein C5B49_07830 [Bdellovibrio sp.]|nr:MAG: hypothetical protein C5B49_07830 [Bdellovibrio sp.]